MVYVRRERLNKKRILTIRKYNFRENNCGTNADFR